MACCMFGACLFLTGPLGTELSEILIKMPWFSFNELTIEVSFQNGSQCAEIYFHIGVDDIYIIGLYFSIQWHHKGIIMFWYLYPLRACSGKQHRKYKSATVLALCKGNPPVTGRLLLQNTSNAESIPKPWHHHESASALGINGLSASYNIQLLMLKNILRKKSPQ